MGNIQRLMVLGAFLFSTSSSFAIYKCVDSSGKTSFQETACAGPTQGAVIDVKPASGQADPNKIQSGEARLAKMKRDNAISDAISKRIPLRGMTVEELKRAMGAPHALNRSSYKSGSQSNQHVYNRPDGTWYVYTDESGVVTDIQHNMQAAVSTPRAQKECPTEHEIRNAETAASSISLPVPIREQKLREVAEMKRCQRS